MTSSGGFRVDVVADSVSPAGRRITTLACRFPRIILAEINTHRAFSRNAASSRAIPVAKMIAQVKNDPFIPVHWGRNQVGMQARDELQGADLAACRITWLEARDRALDHVEQLTERGLHKQVANRLLEPWMWATSLITATDWGNFFALRCHPDAQPEMQVIAGMMRQALRDSRPVTVHPGEWHVPYVDADREICGPTGTTWASMLAWSVARCARVSYLNHDGTAPDTSRDVALAARLAESGHMSPFEHQARPGENPDARSGNLRGWIQYRKELVGEDREDQPW